MMDTQENHTRLEHARKRYIESKKEYFDLLDEFYSNNVSSSRKSCTNNTRPSCHLPDISKSALEYTSLDEAHDSEDACVKEWPVLSLDETLQAVHFFIPIASEQIDRIKTRFSEIKIDQDKLIASYLFPEFISFFNSSFAPVNCLPLNSVRPDAFLNAFCQIQNEARQQAILSLDSDQSK